MPTLAIRCLGPLEITLGDAPLTGFTTQKARALLVYLACHAGQDFPREALQALLWGESDPEHAARSLRQVLVNLRRLLPAGLLATSRLAVSLNLGGDFSLDVTQFERDPADAGLYRGHFLQGFDLRDAPAWEEWLSIRREQLLTRALLALEASGAQHALRGEYPQAVQRYQRALALDAWRETSHQALMCVYALSGDRAAALAQYEKCRAALRKGLDVGPLPETEALYRRILAGGKAGLDEVLFPAQAVSAHASTALSTGAAGGADTRALPFTGRAETHAALISAWGEARRARGGLALVEGEAGLGKTRLVEEALRQVNLRGALVARGRCLEFAAETPYRPLVEALRSILDFRFSISDLQSKIENRKSEMSPVWLAELAALLPELHERFPDLPPRSETAGETARQRLFEAVGRLLRALGRDVVIFLDDLHWADTATLDLINHLVHDFAALTPNPSPALWERGEGVRAGSLWLVGTYRPEETPLDHPLTRLRQGLGRDGLAQHIPLTPLEESHVQAIAAWLSDDPRLAGFLFRESGGSPFVLSEIIRTLQETGRLLPSSSGKWTLHGDLETGQIPERVEDLTLQRVGRLPEAARRWLDFAAVIGERFAPGFLAGVVGETLEELAPCLQAWEERRLLVEDDAGRFGFTHDKIQEAILHALSPNLHKLIHERIGQAMLDSGAGSAAGSGADLTDVAVLAQVAYHFEHSLAPRRAAPYLVRAVEAARQMYALRQALEYAQRLLPLSAGDLQVETLLQIGALLKLLAQNAEAQRVFEQAGRLAEQLGRQDLLARALSGAGTEIAGGGDYPAALKYLTRAVQVARSARSPAVLVEALYQLGWAHHRAGNNRAALDAAAEAMALCDSIASEDPTSISISLRLLCSIHIQTGNYALARSYAERLLAADRSAARREGECRSLNTLGEIARLRGDFAAAQEYYRASLDIAEAIWPFHAQISRRSNLAGALAGAGQYAAAEAELRPLAALPEIAHWPLLAEIDRFLAEACLGQGKITEAWEVAQNALAIAQKAEMADVQVAAWRVLGQIACQRPAAQAEPSADDCFTKSLQLCEQAGLEGERAWTLLAWGKTALMMGEVERGEQLLAEARALFARLDMLWPG